MSGGFCFLLVSLQKEMEFEMCAVYFLGSIFISIRDSLYKNNYGVRKSNSGKFIPKEHQAKIETSGESDTVGGNVIPAYFPVEI